MRPAARAPARRVAPQPRPPRAPVGREQAILVNIFGGIMKCDVIAEGVVQATKEVRAVAPAPHCARPAPRAPSSAQVGLKLAAFSR